MVLLNVSLMGPHIALLDPIAFLQTLAGLPGYFSWLHESPPLPADGGADPHLRGWGTGSPLANVARLIPPSAPSERLCLSASR